MPRLVLTALVLFSCITAACAESLNTEPSLAGAFQLPLRCKTDLNTSRVWGLPDLVEKAICQSPHIAQLWAQAQFTSAQLGSMESGYSPTFTGGIHAQQYQSAVAGTSADTPARISMGASYLLYDFGARDAHVEGAKQIAYAARFTRDFAVQALFLQVVTAYYDMFVAQERVTVQVLAQTAAQATLDATLKLRERDKATLLDVAQAQTALEQTQLTLIAAQGSALLTRGKLAVLAGMPSNTEFSVQAPYQFAPTREESTSLESLITHAKIFRSDLLAASAKTLAAEAELAAAYAADKPTIRVGGTVAATYGAGQSESSPRVSAGVTVTVPWTLGRKSAYAVQSANAQLEATKAAQDALSAQVGSDVWSSYQQLTTSIAAASASASLAKSAERTVQLATAAYAVGQCPLSSLLTAQATLANAQLTEVGNSYQVYVSRFALLEAGGGLFFGNLTRDAVPRE